MLKWRVEGKSGSPVCVARLQQEYSATLYQSARKFSRVWIRHLSQSISLLGFVLFAPLAVAEDCHSLMHLQWLSGMWLAEQGESRIIEQWHIVSPATMEGSSESRLQTSRQLQASESMRVLEMAGAIYYLARVADNALPVAFKLTGCGEGIAVFENPQHDFPTRIEYRLQADKGLSVRVSDGKDKGFDLLFRQQGVVDGPE